MKQSGGIGTMKKYVRIGRSFLTLLLSSRPKVFWWSVVARFGYEKENFGDIITPYLVEKMTGRKPILFSPSSQFAKYFRHAIMTGSIISQSNKNSLVWGSGIIKSSESIQGGIFLAVRGPRTAGRLRELGFNPPSVYGDPGILLPRYYRPEAVVKYRVGVISHYVDFQDIKREVGAFQDVLHIDLLTNDIESVIDQILQCEKIVSTSLHGVIVSHAYGIPALWWKYSNSLSGDDVKFYDYFESVNLTNVSRHEGMSLESVIESGTFYCPDPSHIAEMQIQLLRCFPYKIKHTCA